MTVAHVLSFVSCLTIAILPNCVGTEYWRILLPSVMPFHLRMQVVADTEQRANSELQHVKAGAAH